MQIFYSDTHRGHFPKYELFNGELVTPFECPERIDVVTKHIKEVKFGELVPAGDYGTAPLLRVHAHRYVEYLQTAWQQWAALGRTHDILPFVFPRHGLRAEEPEHIDGKVGFFAFDTGAPICAQTWAAVQGSANCVMSAQKHMSAGARTAFALCRPPGHHAGSSFSGGYCYVNNAAVATQAFLDDGASRVAILDVDYHHGNGTQEIFYNRSDVLFTSIHANPSREFPYFLGYEDERGAGDGIGYNINYQLPDYATYELWGAALKDAIGKIRDFSPDVVIVSLGVDTSEHDPISRFRLKSADFLKIGQEIAGLKLPTFFVLEGGYSVEAFGFNIVSVLRGFSEEV